MPTPVVFLVGAQRAPMFVTHPELLAWRLTTEPRGVSMQNGYEGALAAGQHQPLSKRKPENRMNERKSVNVMSWTVQRVHS
ncbi:hypothetical protein IRJ41_022340 [Triplophysa rosa]|uniref:Uncharacterized protein n=1 Tax=Triplophysa rosa TaxID=992332 RepID=A0A9W8C974_TRIRA|nr:hypothetical protein IRJ41_022340 [Triplophysa rosa]